MKRARRMMHRLLALGRQGRLDDALDDEILAHLELAERDLIREGLSPEDARREARRRFGGVEQTKEEHRAQRSAQAIETFWRDVRYGFASLARDPGAALVTIGMLALGIGANTAMFSLVDAVLLKPLPFPHPERIVRVWEAPAPSRINQTTAFNFSEWKRLSTSFEALSAEHRMTATATISGEPERLSGKLVSADYFDVFRVPPLLGRTFATTEDQPGATPVIVLSHAAWQARFGGDRGVLNQDLILDGIPHRIIGIMPRGTFDRDDLASMGEEPAAFWKPLVLTPKELAASEHWLWTAGRLRAGRTMTQARAEMTSVRAVLAKGFPAYKKDWGIAVEPFDARLVDDSLRQSLYVGFGGVVIVLLIACANVANLLLGKGLARRREMAVRAALGASRGRLVRQLMTETLVVCLLGAVAGIVMARWLIEAAMPLLPSAVPSTAVVSLDYRVFAFTLAVAVGVALLVGLVPSLRTSAGTLSIALNQSSRGSSGGAGRLRQFVVVAEFALSQVLICSALLLFKSLLNLQRVDLGVKVDNVVTISTELPAAGYPTPDTAADFFRSLLERLEAIPGVERASVADDAPLEGAGGENIRLPGGTDRLLVHYKRVGPGYFSTLEIPVIAGREFATSDRAGAVPVTVISQELARALSDRFGITDPIGHIVSLPSLGYEGGGPHVDMQVIGVIRGERVQRNLRLPMEPVAYVSLLQAPRREVNLLLRTTNNPGALMPEIRDVVRHADARLALSRVRTMAEIRRQRSLSGTTEPASLIGTFAVIAALLAGLGVYGVLSHTVTQQRREIGIRMALGATGSEIVTQVLRNAGLMLAIGLAAGLGGALALTRVLSSLLFDVSPLDRVVLVAATCLMAVVGLVAAALPAIRAARVDPTITLRSEG
jgi:putative ABC transport system permease protein